MDKKIFTIPNLLSIFRICLIPLIIYLYMFTEGCQWIAAILTLVSGITDMVDGYIARHYNMISDVGKILDPIADKATLISVLTCIIIKHNPIIILLAAEIFKDIIVGISSYIRMKKNKKVHCANWEGKVCTCISYLTILLHMFYDNIKFEVSGIIVIVVSSIILVLGIIYSIENFLKTDIKIS